MAGGDELQPPPVGLSVTVSVPTVIVAVRVVAVAGSKSVIVPAVIVSIGIVAVATTVAIVPVVTVYRPVHTKLAETG